MSEVKWDRCCVLCAARNRKTRLENGHVCVECAGWLMRSVADIARLCADAAAYITPGSTTGGGSGAFGSKPPVCVDALDPELTMVELNHGDPSSAVTILECLEMWERAVREDRQMAPYGPASHRRAFRIMGAGDGTNQTSVTLTGVVDFLGSQVPWMIDTPDFAVDEFADQIRRCVRALSRWDPTREDVGTMVKCPTMTEDGDCGYRLYYKEQDEHVTCRRCGATRDVSTLIAVAMSDGRPVWVDPEAAARHYGVSESQLRKWARRGSIESNHGRYLLASIVKAVGA